jgi:hypothetical protein
VSTEECRVQSHAAVKNKQCGFKIISYKTSSILYIVCGSLDDAVDAGAAAATKYLVPAATVSATQSEVMHSVHIWRVEAGWLVRSLPRHC